jgi:hypothetical protein
MLSSSEREGRKKRKRLKCPHCGERYGPQTVRCPGCHEPNPFATKPPLKATDRLFGILLLGVGLLIGIPVFYILLWAPHLTLLGGRRGWGLLALVPLGLIFHGGLFLGGVHPKDFYGWWHNRSDLSRALLIGFLVLLGVGVFIFLTFSGD